MKISLIHPWWHFTDALLYAYPDEWFEWCMAGMSKVPPSMGSEAPHGSLHQLTKQSIICDAQHKN